MFAAMRVVHHSGHRERIFPSIYQTKVISYGQSHLFRALTHV